MERVIILHNSGKIAEAIERRGADALRRVDGALRRGALELVNDAKNTMPRFRGETADRTGVEHGGPLEWRIRFATGHARHTEFGTGPGGRPSLAEMIDWVRLKGIQPRDPAMSREQLARVIRRSIAANGVRAQPFATPSLNRMRPRLSQLVRGATREALAAGGAR